MWWPKAAVHAGGLRAEAIRQEKVLPRLQPCRDAGGAMSDTVDIPAESNGAAAMVSPGGQLRVRGHGDGLGACPECGVDPGPKSELLEGSTLGSIAGVRTFGTSLFLVVKAGNGFVEVPMSAAEATKLAEMLSRHAGSTVPATAEAVVCDD